MTDDKRLRTPERLHIGASRLERIATTSAAVTIDMSWTHLGDPPISYDTASSAPKRLLRKLGIRRYQDNPALYAKTNFHVWRYRSGDKLDFSDSRFSFAYSEHVLEHFRFDRAIELLGELFRVLRPAGVARIVVPDADYRTYETAEPAGFPSRSLAWNDPNKHKVRWSVYSLTLAMEFAGFEAQAITYCDEDGNFVQRNPEEAYSGLPLADPDFAFRTDYIIRPKSLVIDGYKRA